MLQTADALKKISPDGFERLASAILRRADPSYQRLIHAGMNTAGQTVKSPVDGICLVPGSNPPHFVIFHYTVDQSLERKWLHEQTPSGKGSRTPDGDIVKALRWTEEQRKDHPDTQITLVLACNGTPNQKLVARSGQVCARHRIELDLWEFSRLLDRLETEPDGQWLRKEHLGIPQERLSIDLLRELSRQSCSLYAKHEQLVDTDEWIDRALDKDLSCRVWESSKAVTLLVAESGQGKTTASYRLMRKHLDAEGLGLWIEPRLLTKITTVEGIIETTLLSLCPTLESGCGSLALKMAAGNGGLVLLIDDVNRMTDSSALVQRVAGWNGSGYRILCPVWPQVLLPLLERFRDSLEPLCFHGEEFSKEEGITAVQRRASRMGRILTRIEAEDLANDLGNDPLLISLWGEGQGRIVKAAVAPVAFSVIASFVQRHLAVLSGKEGSSYLPSEYLEALLELSRNMLEARSLVPT